MRKITNTLIYIMIMLSLCFAVKEFNGAHYDRLACCLLSPIIFFIPKMIRGLFNIKLSNYMELIYIIFVIFAYFIGSIVNLYNTTEWYDIFMHFLSGVLTAILSLVIMNSFSMYNEKKVLFNVIYIISFVLMIASLWEFIEFGIDNILKMNVQHSMETGVKDTIEDMLMAFLGCIIVCASYITNKKAYKKIISKL